MSAPLMDLAEAARAVGGHVVGDPGVRFEGVTTDSRAVAAGDLFVALEGERFDGHGYVDAAARQGAVAALTSRPVEGAPIPQVVAGDSRAALGRLSRHWRQRFAIPLVGLTGSNGKTTVKEMLAAILREHAASAGAVLATQGNLNNDIGVPVTLLRLRDAHRYAVIEMGMNHEGEIAYLTRLASPAVAVVNNAHRAHVGLLGSVEAIARAKGEIYQGLAADGTAVVNHDDAFAGYWRGLNAGRRVVSFGFGEDADVRATAKGEGWHVATPAGGFDMTLRVAGRHNVGNALAACAAAHALGVPPAAMRAALVAFEGVPGRLQRRRTPWGAAVIDDSYNANPDSMKAALRTLVELHADGKKIAVLGEMRELGSETERGHQEVGQEAAALQVDQLIGIGEMGAIIANAAKRAGLEQSCTVGSTLEAAELWMKIADPGDLVLIKGSRLARTEEVIEQFGSRHMPAATRH